MLLLSSKFLPLAPSPPQRFLLILPLAPSFSEAVMISSDTLGVILSGALPREDLIFWLFPFSNSPIP